METNLKYEYRLLTWGGFYNNWESTHGYKEGTYWFDTKEERDKYIAKLHKAELDYPNEKHLMVDLSEGFNCRIKTKLHRVIKYKGKEYYSEYTLWENYPYEAARYHLEWKWTPGFNDYPLGEDFDYNKVQIVQEWITGAFNPINDYNNDWR